MRAFLLSLALLAACEAPKDGTDGPIESPYELPSLADCEQTAAYDYGADGTDDWTQTTRWDAEERVVEYLYESGDLRRYIAYEYDAAGCRVGYTFEDEDGGTLFATGSVSTCDEYGNPVESVFHTTYRGTEQAELVYTYTNTYEDGLLVEQAQAATSGGQAFDLAPDRYTWEYDGDGLVVAADVWDGDTWQYGETWTWHAEDKPLTYHYETASGVTEDQTTTYDEHGRGVTTLYATASDDGARSRLDRRTWDDAHYGVAHSSSDYDEDGTLDVETSFTYDGGWPWSAEVEIDGPSSWTAGDGTHDGTVDHRSRYAYDCD